MKYSCVIVLVISILKVSCDTDDEYENDENVPQHPIVNQYKFSPEIDDCYELYYPNEVITPCRDNKINLFCIDYISEDRNCLGLTTPTNETILFSCYNTENESSLKPYNDTCFQVFKSGRDAQVVCQKSFEKISIGITTPDNYTVLFQSDLCETSLSTYDIAENKKFIKAFTFDPNIRSCYKIYNPDQKVSSYTCLNKNIYETCIDQLVLHKDCTGIVTQNNETIVLDCVDTCEKPERNCFKIYDAENKVHTSCMKLLSDTCFGFTTPSNLTVLVECKTCSGSNGSYGTVYDPEEQSAYRRFVKRYLKDEYLGKNSYLNKTYFEVVGPNEYIEEHACSNEIPKPNVFWLPEKKCYGIILDNNETVITECPAVSKHQNNSGCFNVIDAEMNEYTTCASILNERCVGIKTKGNFSIVLSCFSTYICEKKYKGINVKLQINLNQYKFVPVIGNCYEVYDEIDKVTPLSCRKKTDTRKQYCIDWISDKEDCIGLKTPTNEIIEFACGVNQYDNDDDEEDEIDTKTNTHNYCYNVYKEETSLNTACLDVIDEYGVTITTPDNYTILLHSDLCDASMSVNQREDYIDFIENFSFDPQIRSCFKIFNVNEEVNPFTCLSKDIYRSCIQDFPHHKNCFGITTQNNETIILDCADDSEKLNQKNCFKIYDNKKNLHTSCIQKVEERCVGFITPSNLTVLLECHFCVILNPSSYKFRFEQNIMIGYDPEKQRRFRQFVKTYINNEYLGRNYYLDKIEFDIFNQTDFIEPRVCVDDQPRAYAYWLPNTNCYGITLESNETIILECIDAKENKSHPGCFQVISQNKKEYITCIEILEERCVGIRTRGNLSVVLSCYFEDRCKNNVQELKEYHAGLTAEQQSIYFNVDDCYEVYDENIKVDSNTCTKKAHPENYSCIHWLPGRQLACLGLTTSANETIEIICRNTKENVLSYDSQYNLNRCFNVYEPDNTVKEVCQKKFDNFSLGITTPKNYTILLNSYFCSTSKSPEDMKMFREFVEKFSFDPDVRSCYKIFTEDQEVTPYKCIGREIYDSCVHSLENSNCSGITTQNNETVVLSCSNGCDNGSTNNSKCFKIYSPDGKQHTACQTQLEERCVGIVTPSKLKVLFDCENCRSPYGESLPHYTDDRRKEYRRFIKNELERYKKGEYSFKEEKGFQVANPEQDLIELDCFGQIEFFPIRLLPGHENCLGVTLTNQETIVLDCPDKKPKRPECFDVFSPIYGTNNRIIGPEQKVQNVCVQILNERCIGIITPANWTVALSCTQLPSQVVCSVAQVPSNGPPPRM